MILILLPAFILGCSGWPSSPTGLAGHSVDIVDVRRVESGMLMVRLRYQVSASLERPLVYVCLGRDIDAVLPSSCRFRGLFTASGEIEVDTSASGEDTHYVMAFITSGDLYEGHGHEFEIDVRDLTRRIAARATLHMTWEWRRLI